jgi:hypothetical protein
MAGTAVESYSTSGTGTEKLVYVDVASLDLPRSYHFSLMLRISNFQEGTTSLSTKLIQGFTSHDYLPLWL